MMTLSLGDQFGDHLVIGPNIVTMHDQTNQSIPHIDLGVYVIYTSDIQ